MAEQTAEQALQIIAEKSGVTIPEITALCIEYLKDDIRTQHRVSEFLATQEKNEDKRIAYLEKKNRRIKIQLENFELEPKLNEILRQLHPVQPVRETPQPTAPVIETQGGMIDLTGKPLIK